MKNFQFSKVSNKINDLCYSVKNTLSIREEEEIREQIKSFQDFLIDHNSNKKMVLGFIGQYNAGKSTIIASLTNAKFEKCREEETPDGKKMIECYKIGKKILKIGAQVITDTAEEYEWENVQLLDTPGINAGHPEHDSITLDKLSKCDLLVFVLSNELFNPEGGNFFRKIAFDQKRKGQLLIVINKMTRETGSVKTLTQGILEVIEPAGIEDFYTSFIDADLYLKSLLEDNLEEKDFLESQSHFSEFVFSLEKMIKKNRLTARLYTPLHRAVDLLNICLNILSNENKEQKDLMEFYRRKILILKASKTRLQSNLVTELNKLKLNIWKIGDDIASLCDGEHEKSEIENSQKKSELSVQEVTKDAFEIIQNIIRDEVSRIELEFMELLKSPLGKSILNSMSIPNSDKNFKKIDIDKKEDTSDILKKGPKAFAKLGSFASKVSRDMVYNFVKFFGGKFKPWGAVKAAKFIKNIGPILGALGSILEFFLLAKEAKEKEIFEKKLRDSRAEIRKCFTELGDKMVADFENGWIDNEGVNHQGFNNVLFNDFYGNEIKFSEEEMSKMRNFDESKKDFVLKLQKLLNEINDELEKNAIR